MGAIQYNPEILTSLNCVILDGVLEVDFFIPSNQTFPEASESQQTL